MRTDIRPQWFSHQLGWSGWVRLLAWATHPADGDPEGNSDGCQGWEAWTAFPASAFTGIWTLGQW